MFLKEEEVKMIADIMMGSDGYGMFYQQDLSELHLSAISEAMNQMTGDASAKVLGGIVMSCRTNKCIRTITFKNMTEGDLLARADKLGRVYI